MDFISKIPYILLDCKIAKIITQQKFPPYTFCIIRKSVKTCRQTSRRRNWEMKTATYFQKILSVHSLRCDVECFQWITGVHQGSVCWVGLNDWAKAANSDRHLHIDFSLHDFVVLEVCHAFWLDCWQICACMKKHSTPWKWRWKFHNV